MSYRMSPEFSVGHGTGVHVTSAEGDPMRAVEVATASVPSYEIPFTGVPETDTDPDLPWLETCSRYASASRAGAARAG